MKKGRILFFLLLFVVTAIDCLRCCYPVAATEIDGKDILLLTEQTSLTTLELWKVDLLTGQTNKALMYLYDPMGVALLPSGKGFSFIDRGRIRIKHFFSRSPHSVDFCQPVYQITTLSWLDDERFIFSAQQNMQYKIFLSDLDGTLTTLAEDPACDCSYPAIVEDSLFFLTTDMRQRSSIKKISLSAQEALPGELVLDMGKTHVAFLTMTSLSRGFFVSAPFSVRLEATTINFDFCEINKNDNGIWNQKKLFTFSLPCDAISGISSKRLSESIFPLLPKIFDQKVYFSSLVDELIDLFFYDCCTGEIFRVFPNAASRDRFAPLAWKGKLYYGTTLDEPTIDSLEKPAPEPLFVPISAPVKS
jgi:hypothetical protein